MSQIEDFEDALEFVAGCEEEVIEQMEDGVVKDAVSEVRDIIDDIRGDSHE